MLEWIGCCPQPSDAISQQHFNKYYSSQHKVVLFNKTGIVIYYNAFPCLLKAERKQSTETYTECDLRVFRNCPGR
eukprot:m.247816 g.247816  ORF g.247816 m.247816 type:complete len:75 (+) comp16130_c0_seq16:1377-1601(+)